MMAELLAQDEVMGRKDHMKVMKGKRTKRRGPLSPLALAMVSSCSSEGERSGDNIFELDRAVAASPRISVELTTSTEEEEDMANCLILLARGHTDKKISSVDNHQPAAPNNNIDNIATKASKANAAATTGLYVYQCKTCNRCFPSFQALGGHRASHKKPKLVNEEKKALMLMEEEDDHFSNMSTTLSLKIASSANSLCANIKGNKVHECSICGAEFSSGQALGGHMRRHRAYTSAATTTTTTTTATALSNFGQFHEAKRRRNILQLDLNLPAPEDDRWESKFAFASKEQVIVF